jgi:hypothetical protein
MIFRKRVSLLKKFDTTFKLESTGIPKCLAEKLRISRALYRLKKN